MPVRNAIQNITGNAGGLSVPLATPVITSITTTSTGGSLPATTTYFYKIVAVDTLGGLSLPSNEVSITTAATGTNTITLNWGFIPGAVGIRIYRGTSSNGQSQYQAATNLITFTNTTTVGSITGTLPTTATGYTYLLNNSNFVNPFLYASNTGGLYLVFPNDKIVSNNKGVGAIDLQGNRTNATQVASGQYSALLGGSTNTASSSSSGVFCGSGNKAANTNAVVMGGNSNIASGANSAVFCGNTSIATANYSKAFGAFAIADLFGQTVFTSTSNGLNGDAQSSYLTSLTVTANTSVPKELTLDGSSSYYIIANNSTQYFQIPVTARGVLGTNNAKSAAWKFEGLIVNNGGVLTLTLLPTTVLLKDVAAWDCTLSIVSNRLAITVTGDATSTIKWFASIWHTMNLG